MSSTRAEMSYGAANTFPAAISASYGAANTFPAKVIANKRLIDKILNEHRIPMFHAQLNPTNQCNFNCSFCSCSARDRGQMLSLEQISGLLRTLSDCGCCSATITGGGEPLMHPAINSIIEKTRACGIEVGLVSNGTLLPRLNADTLSKITWIRISSSDSLDKQLHHLGVTVDDWLEKIREHVLLSEGKVDWAFSHVVSKEPNFRLIAKLVNFASRNNFTHARLVNDIHIANDLVEEMLSVKSHLRKMKIDDSSVNYQDRSTWTRGAEQCYISLLKPLIGADGFVYPCCGTQYALDNPARNYESSMRMGFWTDLHQIHEKQLHFDGSSCAKCYYDNYNWALKTLLSELDHLSFV